MQPEPWDDVHEEKQPGMISYSEILSEAVPASFSRKPKKQREQQHQNPGSNRRRTTTRVRSTGGRRLLTKNHPSSSHFDFTPGHDRYVGDGAAGRSLVRPLLSSLKSKREYVSQQLEVMRNQTGVGRYLPYSSSSTGDLQHGEDVVVTGFGRNEQQMMSSSSLLSSSSQLQQGSSLHLNASFSPLRSNSHSHKTYQKNQRTITTRTNQSPALKKRRPRPQTAGSQPTKKTTSNHHHQQQQQQQQQQQRKHGARPRTASARGSLAPVSRRRSVGSSLFDRNNHAAESKLNDLRVHLRQVAASQKLEKRRREEEAQQQQQQQQEEQEEQEEHYHTAGRERRFPSVVSFFFFIIFLLLFIA
jgi:hypothetical protein